MPVQSLINIMGVHVNVYKVIQRFNEHCYGVSEQYQLFHSLINMIQIVKGLKDAYAVICLVFLTVNGLKLQFNFLINADSTVVEAILVLSN